MLLACIATQWALYAIRLLDDMFFVCYGCIIEVNTIQNCPIFATWLVGFSLLRCFLGI